MNYIPSEKIDLARTAFATLVAIVLISLLSHVYIILESFIPLVYVNALLVVGYGIAVSLITKLVMYFGKFRSKSKGVLLAVFLGFVALYTSWVAYLAYLYNDFIPNFNEYLSLLADVNTPANLIFTGKELLEFGTFSLMGGIPITGFLLVVVWMAELAGLLIYPVWIIFNKHLPPYSEEQDAYYDQHVLDDMFRTVYTEGKAVAGLKADPVQYLKESAGVSRYPCSRIIVYTLPHERTAYVSLHNVSLDTKGNEEEKPLVKALEISKQSASAILDNFASQVDKVGPLLN